MKAAKFVASPLLGAVHVGKKLFAKPKAGAAVPGVARRDTIRDQLDRELALLRRRGGAADIVTGAYGAEAPPGGKITLGS